MVQKVHGFVDVVSNAAVKRRTFVAFQLDVRAGATASWSPEGVSSNCSPRARSEFNALTLASKAICTLCVR